MTWPRWRSLGGIPCVILGAGGHARVVIDAMEQQGKYHPWGILDRDRRLWGTRLDGVLVVGGDDVLPKLVTEGVQAFTVGVGSIGDMTPRIRLFQAGVAAGLAPATLVHPSAIISRRARIDAGCHLMAASVVHAGARLGQNVIVNTSAVVEHDCDVADHVHIATGAKLASTVRIGSGAHIGAGSTVRQSISIGEGAIVAAGAVVVTDVAPGTVVMGVPAKVRS